MIPIRSSPGCYAALVECVVPVQIPPTIQNDPADDQVLAVAVASSADVIVSGDADLLNLKSFQGIDILTASAAWERALILGLGDTDRG